MPKRFENSKSQNLSEFLLRIPKNFRQKETDDKKCNKFGPKSFDHISKLFHKMDILDPNRCPNKRDEI